MTYIQKSTYGLIAYQTSFMNPLSNFQWKYPVSNFKRICESVYGIIGNGHVWHDVDFALSQKCDRICRTGLTDLVKVTAVKLQK